jgi:hypothetical protein
MVNKVAKNLSRYLMLVLIYLLLVFSAILSSYMSPAHAVGTYNNYELANHAATFIGRNGGDACLYTGQTNLANGQCKTFVDCIVYAVSGRAQITYPGYNEGFRDAGGIEVARDSATIGDIIQVLPGIGMLQHTAIIAGIGVDGSFSVIDSNWDYNGRVKQHNWNPANDARFWRMGRTNQPIIGNLESITRVPGGIRAEGWAIDQDTSNSIEAHVYGGDGEINPQKNPGVPLIANVSRADVGAAYPKYGSKHGFKGVVGTKGSGNQRICAYGINAPNTPGATTSIGCKNINVSVNPFGYVDSIKRVSGGVRIRGWVIDPDVSTSITVHAYGNTGSPGVTTNPFKAVVANITRSDLAAHYPDYGTKHGYDFILPISAKKQQICVYAINNTANSYNPQIGCKTI